MDPINEGLVNDFEDEVVGRYLRILDYRVYKSGRVEQIKKDYDLGGVLSAHSPEAKPEDYVVEIHLKRLNDN